MTPDGRTAGIPHYCGRSTAGCCQAQTPLVSIVQCLFMWWARHAQALTRLWRRPVKRETRWCKNIVLSRLAPVSRPSTWANKSRSRSRSSSSSSEVRFQGRPRREWASGTKQAGFEIGIGGRKGAVGLPSVRRLVQVGRSSPSSVIRSDLLVGHTQSLNVNAENEGSTVSGKRWQLAACRGGAVWPCGRVGVWALHPRRGQDPTRKKKRIEATAQEQPEADVRQANDQPG